MLLIFEFTASGTLSGGALGVIQLTQVYQALFLSHMHTLHRFLHVLYKAHGCVGGMYDHNCISSRLFQKSINKKQLTKTAALIHNSYHAATGVK